MRIDSQHPGYLQDDSRARDIDPATDYGFALPELPPEPPPIFVDGDILEPFGGPGAVGMAPFFGLDGIEALPPVEYEVGLDGPAEASLLFDPIGIDLDGFNARGADFPRALIVEPVGIDLDHVAPHQRNPAPSPAAFHADDALEPRLAAALRTGTPPQIGDDGVGLDPPGFDVRQPIVGADDVDYTPSLRRPVPAPAFLNPGDGVEYVRRDRAVFAN